MLGLPGAQFLQIMLERLNGYAVGQPFARQRALGVVDVAHVPQRADARQHGQAEYQREGGQQFAGGGQVLQECPIGSLDGQGGPMNDRVMLRKLLARPLRGLKRCGVGGRQRNTQKSAHCFTLSIAMRQ